MIYIGLAIIVLLLAAGLKPAPKGFNEEYLNKGTSDIIKGAFILMVFLAHATQYLKSIDNPIASVFGQLIVVMFLFYSGYGVTCKLNGVDGDQVKGYIFVHRIGGTLINFDVAVLVFLAVQTVLGKGFPLSKVVLSFVGWESLGNSNWYIFDICLLYGVSFVAVKVANCMHPELRRLCVAGVVSIMIAVLWLILMCLRPSWWYDTMFAYGFGAIFALHKHEFERMIKTHYWKVLIILATVFCVTKISPVSIKGLVHNIRACAFAGLIVLFTMKLQLSSLPLKWCGERIFPIYIYQRVPMIILSSLWADVFLNNAPLFLLVSTIFTGFIAWAYPIFCIKLDGGRK